jgi:mRNA interferase MazF
VFAFGSIVRTRFPFTDLSGAKRRPALVVSRDNERRSDLIVCFITSTPRAGPNMASLLFEGNGEGIFGLSFV